MTNAQWAVTVDENANRLYLAATPEEAFADIYGDENFDDEAYRFISGKSNIRVRLVLNIYPHRNSIKIVTLRGNSKRDRQYWHEEDSISTWFLCLRSLSDGKIKQECHHRLPSRYHHRHHLRTESPLC